MLDARLLAHLRTVAWCLACAVTTPSSPALAQSPGDPPAQPATPPTTPWYQAISVNGLVSASYEANFNNPASRTNQFRVFDTDEGSATLDEVELVVQRAISSPGQAGFRVDLTLGTMSRVTAAAGLFRDASGEAGDLDMRQAFASYIAPLGKGLRIDVGKFVTHVGYEVSDGYDGFNDNHTRGLLFGYAEPITHTGVRLSYPFGEKVSGQVLVVNGWDNAVDNNTGKSVGAQLAWTVSPRLAVTMNYLGGPEQPNNNDHLRHLADLVVVAKLAPAVTLVGVYDYGHEAAVRLADTAGGGVMDSSWQGVAGYARYALSARAAVTLRAEWFDDPEGARTQYAQTLKEVTLTPEFRVLPTFIVRGDLRRDQSDRAVFEQGDGSFGHGQTTVSVNVLFVF
jgi:hypothetical protein